jgi:hypothetical protein
LGPQTHRSRPFRLQKWNIVAEHYKTYAAVVESLAKKKRKAHLLLGNGFSMAYDPKIFSYNALYDFVAGLGDRALIKLFEAIKTKNFEQVMGQLDLFVALLDAFESNEGLQDRVRQAGTGLQQSLLNAVGALHPEHVFKVPADRLAQCAAFLNFFLANGGSIFTTNYDLLLYWVLLRGGIPNHGDGFGRELMNPVRSKHGEEAEWSELRWGPNRNTQNIHYVHGALHLFDTRLEIVKEECTSDSVLLEKIMARIKKSEYPLFVTAGDGDEKLERIRHNQYLTFCYDQLCAAEGSLVTFGFNFGKYDLHIIQAINKAASLRRRVDERLGRIYIGVYSEDDASHIAAIEGSFKLEVNTFEAKTAPVWNAP